MNIVIAPDSFKESLSAQEVAHCIASGFREIFPDAHYSLLPIADGGEGTVEAMVAATGGMLHHQKVCGPLGTPVDGFFGISGDGSTAIIEMAAAGGLALVPMEQRNPLLTTTRGTGELILAALDKGVRELIIGIGGSATNDGGAGMLQALGVGLLDARGQEIPPGGGGLHSIEKIDLTRLDPRLKHCRIQVACDVDNPLTGSRGASAVFGPQKGASPAMVVELDANLERFGKLLEELTGKTITTHPGAGAAGGMGAALYGILDAELRPGIQIVIEAVKLEAELKDADLVITGEGKLDNQTAGGKAPSGVARLAAQHDVPVIAIGGGLAADAALRTSNSFAAMFAAVSRPCALSEAMAEAETNLRRASRNIAAALQLGMQLGMQLGQTGD